jgi:hypothetical protein
VAVLAAPFRTLPFVAAYCRRPKKPFGVGTCRSLPLLAVPCRRQTTVCCRILPLLAVRCRLLPPAKKPLLRILPFLTAHCLSLPPVAAKATERWNQQVKMVLIIHRSSLILGDSKFD